jgi:uracil-DNA glycosylase family 4
MNTKLRRQFEAHAADMGLQVEVFSDGPLDAEVVFIGEGPGEVERRKGLPFVGGSGKLMFEMAKISGFTREEVYATNVVKRQISLSTKSDARHAVLHDELGKWCDLTRWELSQLKNVKVIVCFGNYAIDAVAGLDGITKWRGSVLPMELPNGVNGHVVCTFNAAYVMHDREPRFEPFVIKDIRKASMVLKNTFKPHLIDEIINPTYKEAKAFIRDLRKVNRPIALDIEAINKELACIGLSNNPHRAMCINLRDLTKNRFTLDQEIDLLHDIQALCDSHKMIGQNAQFDAYFSRLHWLIKIRFWFDTLLAHHALFPLLPHSLAFLTAQYTNHPYYKDDIEEWHEGGDIDSFWRYNCKDAAITYACYEKMHQELIDQKMNKMFFDHVMRAQPHLVEATVHGVATDMSVKEKILKLVQEDVDVAEKKFLNIVHELTGDDEYNPNPNSWSQMKDLFFNRLKLEGRGQSTDEANRKMIMANAKTPPLAKEMLAALDKFKEEDKFRGTYAEARVSDDGRFRCEYKQFGVSRAPGRLSSSQLLVEKEGGNMQNQPMRARGMYIADPGCVLLYFDLAQAEAQVVSFRADIESWKAQFALAKKDGKYDCHRALASEMFKIPYDEVPIKDWDERLNPTKRYVAKRCRHGLNYRMERFKLSQVTQLPYHEAARAFVLYHNITPELRHWWKAEEDFFRKERAIYNPFGRRLKIIQRINDDVLDSIVAFYPQSTIGDKIVQVWYQCAEDDAWPTGKARIAIDVHDNLVAVATPSVAKTCLKIMKKYAESPIYIQDVYKRRKPEPLSIPCELKMSYPTSWSDKAKRDKKTNEWLPGFVPHKNGLHRWSDMEVVQL